MGLSPLKILSILNLGIFLVLMFTTTGDKNKLFLKYILLSYPLLAIYIIPVMTGFELISYVFMLFFFKRKDISFSAGIIYQILFFVLISVAIIGALVSESLGTEYFTDFISIFPVFIFGKVLIDECLEDSLFFYTVISWLKITLVVSLIFLCLQFVLGVEFSLSKTQNSNILISDGIRYPSFLSDPQVYSQFLAVLSFVCLIRNFGESKLPLKNYILVILTLVAILVTGGRAGFLGWAVGLCLVIIFGNSNYRITFLITCIALYFVVYNFSDSFSIFKRSGDLSETFDFRYAIWQEAYEIFLQNPFFGIGLGNYAHYVSLHNPDQFWLMDNEFIFFDHPESGYLKFLTELGILGFCTIFLLILIPVIKAFFFYIKTKDTSLILLIASILSWMVGFYSTYSFGDVRIKILIVTIICLLITSPNRLSQEYAEENIQ